MSPSTHHTNPAKSPNLIISTSPSVSGTNDEAHLAYRVPQKPGQVSSSRPSSLFSWAFSPRTPVPPSSTTACRTTSKTFDETNEEARINKEILEQCSKDMLVMQEKLTVTQANLIIARQDCDALRTSTYVLKRYAGNLEGRIESLEAEMSAQAEEISYPRLASRSQSADSEDEYHLHIQTELELQEEIETLKVQLVEAQDELAEKAEHIACHDDRMREFQAEKKDLEEDLEVEQRTDQDLQGKLLKSDEELDFSKSYAAELKRKLRETVDEAKTPKQQLAARQNKIEDSVGASIVEAMWEKLAACEERVEELQDAVCKRDMVIAKVANDNLTEQATMMQQELKYRELEMANKVSDERVQSLAGENDVLASELAMLKRDLHEHELKLARTSASNTQEDSNTLIEGLLKDLERKQLDLDNERAKNAVEREYQQRQERKIADLRKDKDELEGKLQEHVDEKLQLTSANVELHTKNTELEQLVVACNKRIAGLQYDALNIEADMELSLLVEKEQQNRLNEENREWTAKPVEKVREPKLACVDDIWTVEAMSPANALARISFL
jgi:hypothetical protein